MTRWLVALCGLLGSAAVADIVHLKDGRTFEGVVEVRRDGTVAVDTMIGAIRTTLTFRGSEVERIEPTALRDDHFKPAAPASASVSIEPVTRDAASATYYLEFPIVGEFGRDVLPRAVEETLEFAVRRKIEHIVFRIDSPGGDVWAADGIAAALERYDDQLTYYAVVERAMSAAIWVAFSCDAIFVTPSAAMGAAVVFTRDQSSGAAEVDAKMNSAYAAILGGIAERHGRPAAVARAMVSQDAELYTWLDETGERAFAGEAPRVSWEYERLDTPDTVLTLTGQEMLRLGLARGRALASTDVGVAMGFAGWREPMRFGSATAEKMAARAKEAVKEIEQAGPRIEAALEEAAASDPLRYSYSTGRNGEYTENSLALWRQRCDQCMLAWRRVSSLTGDLLDALDDAEELGLPLEFDELRRTARDWKSTAGREVVRLKELRRRTGR